LLAAGWLGNEHKSYLERIRQKITDAGFGIDFEYLGEISRAEKIHFLGSLDVLSVPVLYPAPKGLYALEAMACGTPVIQPNLGIFPELISSTQGGLLHSPGDINDLASKLEWLLNNREEAMTLGQQGRKAVFENFHSRRVAVETIEVYEKLCDVQPKEHHL
jgi:glycosyltransferase involved in cell wall biosynthesis